MRCTVAAVSGGVGATALALAVIPTLLQYWRGAEANGSITSVRAARYASVATLPLAASGFIVALPTLTASLIALALCSALAYRSGSLGARVFLELRGLEQTLIAAFTSVVATLPSLLAAPLHAVR